MPPPSSPLMLPCCCHYYYFLSIIFSSFADVFAFSMPLLIAFFFSSTLLRRFAPIDISMISRFFFDGAIIFTCRYVSTPPTLSFDTPRRRRSMPKVFLSFSPDTRFRLRRCAARSMACAVRAQPGTRRQRQKCSADMRRRRLAFSLYFSLPPPPSPPIFR
jgi:hypothetical protein